MSNPTSAAVISHKVENFETWKAAFDAHAQARTDAGIAAAHVNQAVEDPNQVTVYLASDDDQAIAAFIGSPDLKDAMQQAGVVGAPSIAFVTPVENETVTDRPLAGVIIRHEVEDYTAWKKGFDAHGEARGAAGVVGHAINCAADNPNLVILYLQAEKVEQLQGLAGSDELKAAMKDAGVKGAPDISFVQGGDWS